MFLGLSINEFSYKRKFDYRLCLNHCVFFRKTLNILFLIIVPSIVQRIKTYSTVNVTSILFTKIYILELLV